MFACLGHLKLKGSGRNQNGQFGEAHLAAVDVTSAASLVSPILASTLLLLRCKVFIFVAFSALLVVTFVVEAII